MPTQSSGQISSDNPRSVAIVGAGIAGLTAAYALQQQGVHSVVFESQPTTGGAISTEIVEDGWIEWGASTLRLRNPTSARLLADLGLMADLVPIGANGKIRYVATDDGLTRLSPKWLLSAYRRHPLSLAMLLSEPWRTGSPAGISFGGWITDHFGPAALSAADAFCTGVYGIGAHDIQASFVLRSFWDKQAGGSAILPLFKTVRELRTSGRALGDFPRSSFLLGGNQKLTNTLTAKLDVRVNHPVISCNGTQLAHDHGTHDWSAVVLATPPLATSQLLGQSATDLFDGVSEQTLALHYLETESTPEAFGLVNLRSDAAFKAVQYIDQFAPQRVTSPSMMFFAEADASILDIQAQWQSITDRTQSFANHRSRRVTLPVVAPSATRHRDKIEAFEQQNEGLFLHGSWVAGLGVAAIIDYSFALAERIARSLAA